MRRLLSPLLLLVLVCPALPCLAQSSGSLDTPEALLQSLYKVISGPAGQKRDWDRMRSLFLPGAKMIGARRAADRSQPVTLRVMDVEDYIRLSGPVLEQQGFYEYEVARQLDTYGIEAHAFSTYEIKHKMEDATPMTRGINS